MRFDISISIRTSLGPLYSIPQQKWQADPGYSTTELKYAKHRSPQLSLPQNLFHLEGLPEAKIGNMYRGRQEHGS